MNTAQDFFILSCGFYILSLVLAFILSKRALAVYLSIILALGLNATAVLMRYYQAWPMLPMYLGPVALPLFLALLTLLSRHSVRNVEYRPGNGRRLAQRLSGNGR